MRDTAVAGRFKPMDYVRNLYRIVSEEGTSIDTVLSQEYYVHIAQQLRPGDEIVIVCEDDSYRVHVEVADCGPQWARVRVLNQWNWDEEAQHKPAPASDEAKPKKAEAEYRRVWKGAHDLHCIERVSDGVIMQTGIKDKSEAERIAANYAPKAA